MPVLKRLLVPIAATVATVFLVAWSLDAFGFRSPVFALLVNWLIMSWIAILGQVIHFSFPLAYYHTRPFEQSGRLYERLGIRLCQRLVRRGPLTIFSPTLAFPKGNRATALRYLDGEMRNAETGHALVFVAVLPFAAFALLQGWFDAGGWILFFDILINAYPVMLQRYNRIRLHKLLHMRAAAPR